MPNHGLPEKILACLLMLATLLVIGYSVSEATAPTACPHQFRVEVVRLATDDTDGERLYTCELCGYTYTEKIPAQGHAWGEWELNVAPTCDTAGRERRICVKHASSPHYQYREVAPLGHDYGEWQVTLEPTAESEGEETRTCKRDSSHVEKRPLAKLTAVTTTPTTTVATTPLAPFPCCPPKPEPPQSNTLNTMDIVLGTTFIGFNAIMLWSLAWSFHVLLWYRRKKKAFLQKRRELRLGRDDDKYSK